MKNITLNFNNLILNKKEQVCSFSTSIPRRMDDMTFHQKVTYVNSIKTGWYVHFPLTDTHSMARIINEEVPFTNIDANGLNPGFRFMAASTRNPQTIDVVSRITNLDSLEMVGLIASIVILSYGIHLVIHKLRQLRSAVEINDEHPGPVIYRRINRLETDIPDLMSFLPERIEEATENLRRFNESDEFIERIDLNYIPSRTMETLNTLNINYNIMLEEFGETLASENVRSILIDRNELSTFESFSVILSTEIQDNMQEFLIQYEVLINMFFNLEASLP